MCSGLATPLAAAQEPEPERPPGANVPRASDVPDGTGPLPDRDIDGYEPSADPPAPPAPPKPEETPAQVKRRELADEAVRQEWDRAKARVTPSKAQPPALVVAPVADGNAGLTAEQRREAGLQPDQTERAEAEARRDDKNVTGAKPSDDGRAGTPVGGSGPGGDDLLTTSGVESQATSDPCAPQPGDAYGVTWAFAPAFHVALAAASQGRINATVTNRGTQGWPAGTSITYRIFDRQGAAVAGPAAVTGIGAVPSYFEVTVEALVDPLPEGLYRLAWDVVVPGVGALSGQGVCTFNLDVTSVNTPPSLSLVSPPQYGTVTTQTPTLSVSSTDPDVGDLREFFFKKCLNAQMSTDCVASGWIPTSSWTLPVGAVNWGGTFYWSALVRDEAATTDAQASVAPNQVLVVVPATAEWRRVGNGLGMANLEGLVLPYGVYVHTQRDASIAGGAVPLSVDRHYSSGASAAEGAFGLGWMSVLDSRTYAPPTPGLRIVVYPDGREESFGANGAGGWVTRADLGSTTRLTALPGGRWQVRQSSTEVLLFDSAGRLERIDYAGAGAVELRRDASGLVSQLVQRPSGRTIDITWTTGDSGCTTTTRPTQPYVKAMSTRAGPGAAVNTWNYIYSCNRLIGGGVTGGRSVSYSYPSSTAFNAYSGGRLVAGVNAPSGWGPSPTSSTIQERTISIRLSNSHTQTVVQRQAAPGYEQFWQDVYNGYGGMLTTWCKSRPAAAYGDCPSFGGRTYVFDTLSRLREERRTEASGGINATMRRWDYDQAGPDIGRLTYFTDEMNRGVSYQYDAYGNPKTSFAYSVAVAGEQVTSSSGYTPFGTEGLTRQAWVAQSPHDGRLLNAEEFTYDNAGRLTRRVGHAILDGHAGDVADFTYTTGTEQAVSASGPTAGTMPAGLLRTVRNTAGTTTFAYNTRGDQTRTDEPSGRIVLRDFGAFGIDDGLGVVLSERVTDGAGADRGSVAFTYDRMGRTVLESRGCVTNAVTGAQSRLLVERTYRGDGLLGSTAERAARCDRVEDVLPARRTSFSYDGLGRVSAMTDAVGGVTTYSYDPYAPGRLASQTDPRGKRTEMLYELKFGLLEERLEQQPASGGGTTMVTAWLGEYDDAGNLIRESDALNRKTLYTLTGDSRPYKADLQFYDATSRLWMTRPLWKRMFDGAGRVVKETGPGGRVTAWTYDAEGRLATSTVDPAGLNRVTRWERDSSGRLLAVQLSDAVRTERTSFTVNATGEPLSTTVGSGATLLTDRVLRDPDGRVIASLDPRSNGPADTRFRTDLSYDSYGQLTRSLGPAVKVDSPANTSTYAGVLQQDHRPEELRGYNAFGELTELRDARGGLTENSYDTGGRLTVSVLPPVSVLDLGGLRRTERPARRLTYNPAGDVLTQVEPGGRESVFSYDLLGRLTAESGPLVNGERATASHSYDAASQLTETTHPNGLIEQFRYDAFGQLVARIQQADTSPLNTDSTRTALQTSYGYNSHGDLTGVVTPGGLVTNMDYNAAGELTYRKEPGLSIGTRFSYDIGGRLVEKTEPTGIREVHSYDPAGRKISVSRIGADGNPRRAEYSYDAAGNLISQRRNSPTASTTTSYDALSRPVAVTRPLPDDATVTVQAGYDPAGNRVRTTDARGNITWTGFDALNRTVSTVEPSTAAHANVADRRWETSYNPGGETAELRKPGGASVSSDYDTAGRLTGQTGRAPGRPDEERVFGYDVAGRMAWADSSLGRQSLQWSHRDQLAGSTGPAGNTFYAHDADGRMTHRNDYAGQVNFGYDATGNLSLANWPTANHVNSGWTRSAANGRLTEERSWDTITSYTYDNWGDVATATTKHDGTTLKAVAYTYDSDGRLASRDVSSTSSTPAVERDTQYGYDELGRLITETSPATARPGGPAPAPGSTWITSYGYDDANNRTEMSTNDPTAAVTRRQSSFDERNRLLSQTVIGQDRAVTPVTVTTTPAGNVSSIDSGGRQPAADRRLAWNAFDELINGNGIEYTHDAFGRVLRRDDGREDTLKRLAYSGLDQDPVEAPAGDKFEHAIRTPSGQVLSTEMNPATEPAAQRPWRRPLPNSHGDINAFIIQDGNQLDGQVNTDAYGTSRDLSAAVGDYIGTLDQWRSSFGFQGSWTDSATGLVDMQARTYDPNLGAFLSRDSFTFPFGGAETLNLYGYGNADPTNHTDPTGYLATPAPLVKLYQDIGIPSAVNYVDNLTRRVPYGTVGRVGARVGSRFVPVVGWARNAYDGYSLGNTLYQWATRPPPSLGAGGGGGIAREPRPPGPPSGPALQRPPRGPAPAPPAPPPPPPPPSPSVVASGTNTWLSDSWTTSSSTFTPTHRTVTVSTWAEQWAQNWTGWSDGGRYYDVARYLGDVLQGWRSNTVRTIDPHRQDGTATNGADALKAVIGAVTSILAGGPAGTPGACGLTGTALSCLAGETASISKLACRGLNARATTCAVTEPTPGRPTGTSETANDQPADEIETQPEPQTDGAGARAGNGGNARCTAIGQATAARARAKPGPKPAGVGPHNLTIDSRIQELVRQGYEHLNGGTLKEEYLRTPGGVLGARRPDITMRALRT